MLVLSLPIHLMHVHDSTATILNVRAFHSVLIQSWMTEMLFCSLLTAAVLGDPADRRR